MLSELGAALRKSASRLPSLTGHGFWRLAAWADNFAAGRAFGAAQLGCNPRHASECGTMAAVSSTLVQTDNVLGLGAPSRHFIPSQLQAFPGGYPQ
jgi:hypothetical protein